LYYRVLRLQHCFSLLQGKTFYSLWYSLEVCFGKDRVLVLVRSQLSLRILSALNCLLLTLNVVSLLGYILSDVHVFVFPFFFASVGLHVSSPCSSCIFSGTASRLGQFLSREERVVPIWLV